MKKKILTLVLTLSLSLSLAACGGAPKEDAVSIDVNLTDFYGALLEDYEWPMLMPLEDEPLDTFYPGLRDLELEQCSVSTAAISAAVAEIALVEVKDADDVSKVEDIFQARIDYQVGDGDQPGGAFYPMTIEGWQNDSYIASNGNYVMLAAGDHASDAVEAFNGLFA